VDVPYLYDAFISYRHSGRQKLISNALQRALQRFARPFWRLRAARIFRDETNLSARPDLFGQVTAALDKSRCLILMASPEAAASHWVRKEHEYWIEKRGLDNLIIVLTDGNLYWNSSINGFDIESSTSMPPEVLVRFRSQPLWVDLRWLGSSGEQATTDDPRFLDAVATVAAALRGVDKDEVAGDAVRQKRIVRWAAGSLITILLALTGALSL
jgi:MTH538 TIR-like domain (DUF1863)